mmetsp:Transcript_14032/g.36031  ORF Transcript_14032/g.36031 Transcript_14032/m.36031 type:complete len:83 (+) Transcript_14032:254-502(+)|eukprot:jgi/Tetstr1/428174/TSEL_018225.t1
MAEPNEAAPGMASTEEGNTQAATNGAADCLTCRTIGTLVPLSCTAYLLSGLAGIPRANRLHRACVLAAGGGFAALGVARALV